jgi:hypothetical protein
MASNYNNDNEVYDNIFLNVPYDGNRVTTAEAFQEEFSHFLREDFHLVKARIESVDIPLATNIQNENCSVFVRLNQTNVHDFVATKANGIFRFRNKTLASRLSNKPAKINTKASAKAWYYKAPRTERTTSTHNVAQQSKKRKRDEEGEDYITLEKEIKTEPIERTLISLSKSMEILQLKDKLAEKELENQSLKEQNEALKQAYYSQKRKLRAIISIAGEEEQDNSKQSR